MQIRPAIHISFFGVFPTKPLDETLREGFTAAKAALHASEVAKTGTLTEMQLERYIKGMPELEDIIDFENLESAQEMQDNISTVSRQRMRHAYQIAANEKWIKPLQGCVFIADPIDLDAPGDDLRDEIERRSVGAFYDFIDRGKTPDLINPSGEKPNAEALTGVGYIRCIVGGRSVKLTSFVDELSFFKSTTQPHSEPPLDPGWFDMSRIDTYEWCRAKPTYAHSRYMGFSGYTMPPALIM
jgi:hypothetical protein